MEVYKTDRNQKCPVKKDELHRVLMKTEYLNVNVLTANCDTNLHLTGFCGARW